MIAAAAEAQTFPNGMLWFSFIASLTLTLAAATEVILRLTRRPTLSVLLTRDVFFRILESGESIYANAIIVSYGSGALIQNVTASLKKEDGATKEFKLRVAQVGEKARMQDGTHKYSFHSTSPLAFIPPGNPQRQAFVCEYEDYARETNDCFQRHLQGLFRITHEIRSASPPHSAPFDVYTSEAKKLASKSTADIMDNIQIEKGEYSLTISIEYSHESGGLIKSRLRTASSTIKFCVEDYAKELIRNSLEVYLMNRNPQPDSQVFNPAPEYSPSKVREVTNWSNAETNGSQ